MQITRIFLLPSCLVLKSRTPNESESNTNMILILMGVCGSGKTTVGTCLATKLNWQFADADEFHSEENKMKMAAGLPLTDQDRLPWLQSIHKYGRRLSTNGQSGVITCSALKRVYRDVLRYGDSPSMHFKGHAWQISDKSSGEEQTCLQTLETSGKNLERFSSTESTNNLEKKSEIKFVHLTGSEEVLEHRMVNRLGHFMPAKLLKSQLDTLETLDKHENGITVDIDKSVEEIVKEIVDRTGL